MGHCRQDRGIVWHAGWACPDLADATLSDRRPMSDREPVRAVAEEFLKHSQEEQGHADQIAERIVQLGGAPDFDPAGLSTRSHSEYVAAAELVEMIRENLVAERVAIESYSEIIRYIGEGDPTTRRLMEEILAVEEEHADDMKTLLEALGPQSKSEQTR